MLLSGIVLLLSSCESNDEQSPMQEPNEQPPLEVVVESVTVTPAVCELLVDEELTLSAEVLPADADYSLEWTSTNRDVVTVFDGKIKGIAPGTAIIIAKAGDVTGSTTVTVISTPVESISLDYSELELEEGGSFTLTATIFPENADNKSIRWESSASDIVEVNGAGNLTAIRSGEAVITARAGKCSAECRVTVTAADLAVGDYYYSDGSWSQSLDPTRTPIGVVFYVGDITASDPLLKAEHPHCTHGLVVALDEKTETCWQANYLSYQNTVGNWVENNTEYETITTGTELTDNLNRPMGYHNTKAIEAFNIAPENSEWPVNAVEYIVEYRSAVPAPKSSSDWYLGSSKEMSLLVSGEYDQNIWDIRDTGISVQNKKDVNKKIAKIEGAIEIGTAIPVMMFYWTSSEFSFEFAGGMVPMNGQMPQMFKSDGHAFYTVRAILAF